MKCQHPAIKREQSLGLDKFRHWRRATDYCDCAYLLRHGRSRRISVGSAAGYREHSKFADTKMPNDSFHNAWPIRQLALRLQARPTDARPIWSNDANTKLTRWFVCESR